ncbi:MAG: ComF family protein [Gammaproteobacteria bacterium]|nr:ComF family protein [Gammaproteobacteria bacterium]
MDMVYIRTKFNQSVFSHPCLLCQQLRCRGGVCEPCRALLPVVHHACLQCGLPLDDHHETVCGRCLQHPPYVDHTIPLFHYAPPMAQMICRLKFQQGLEYARSLGELMANRLQQLEVPLPQVLIPVPLHPRRMRSRGYNQALELARPIGRQLQLPIDTKLCLRARHTHEQSQLSIKERKKNIRRAFSLCSDAKLYQHVAIIDDVVTTGHTVNELARILKQAGIKRVDVWTCCRA